MFASQLFLLKSYLKVKGLKIRGARPWWTTLISGPNQINLIIIRLSTPIPTPSQKPLATVCCPHWRQFLTGIQFFFFSMRLFSHNLFNVSTLLFDLHRLLHFHNLTPLKPQSHPHHLLHQCLLQHNLSFQLHKLPASPTYGHQQHGEAFDTSSCSLILEPYPTSPTRTLLVQREAFSQTSVSTTIQEVLKKAKSKTMIALFSMWMPT